MFPYRSAVEYNGAPINIEPMDTYWANPTSFQIPSNQIKMFTGDLEQASLARLNGVDVTFSKDAFKINKQLKALNDELNSYYKANNYLNLFGTQWEERGNQLDEQIRSLEKQMRDLHENYIQSHQKAPTLEDYQTLERETGLISDVRSDTYDNYHGPDDMSNNRGLIYNRAPRTHANVEGESEFFNVGSTASQLLHNLNRNVVTDPSKWSESSIQFFTQPGRLVLFQKDFQSLPKEEQTRLVKEYSELLQRNFPNSDVIKRIINGEKVYHWKLGGKMNYLDFFKIPKAKAGTKFWDKFKDDPYGPKEIDSEDWPSLREIGHAAAYMLPVYGTYLSVNDAIEDPTWYNIGTAVLSGLGDVGTLAGVGWAGKAAVVASKASKLAKMTKGAEKAAHAAKAADKALDAELHGIKAGETALFKGMINTGTHGKAFNHKDGGAITNISRLAKLNQFLKSRGKDPSKLSKEELHKAMELFHKASGDEVLRYYNSVVEEHKKGGSIHIKKKNRGTFTEYCNGHVTEECIERGKHSSNPTTRKRATFAANARTWKHQEGGSLFSTTHTDFGDDLSVFATAEKLPSVIGVTPDYMKSYNIPTISSDASSPITISSASNGTAVTVPTPTTRQEAKTLEKELRALAKLLGDKGVPVRITSLNRPGATTSNGRTSFHSTGSAMDIVPVNGKTFQDLQDLIKNDKEVQKAFEDLGVGILDETTQEALDRTGGTGAHFHIGPDKVALAGYQKIVQS